MYAVTNPATGELVEEYPTATDEQIGEAADAVSAGYRSWAARPVAERAEIVARAARLFAERTDELAAIITLEMGKRIKEAKGELALVVSIFDYYAEHGGELLADEPLPIQGGSAVITKGPIGPLVGIMPWNFPYYQAARFVAPNLVLGNTIVLKHAPICPRSSAAMEQLLHDAGVPGEVYRNIYATNEQIAGLLADPRIRGVSLTGSDRAGAAVAAEAGRNLKKVVLELGGSDPMIVLDSTDVARTAKIAAVTRLANCGQACNAPKRMIVAGDLYDDFVAAMTERLAGYEPGDPADPATKLPPLSSREAADRVAAQLDTAVRQGATLRVGGPIDGPGAYLAPALLTDVTAGMDAYREEIFGPVVIVMRAGSEDEAIALANDTEYGLGASVFSSDPERARRVADRIEAGMVTVNTAGGSQADLPFGGVKRSGMGRELGPLGIEEFMNKKTIRL